MFEDWINTDKMRFVAGQWQIIAGRERAYSFETPRHPHLRAARLRREAEYEASAKAYYSVLTAQIKRDERRWQDVGALGRVSHNPRRHRNKGYAVKSRWFSRVREWVGFGSGWDEALFERFDPYWSW